MEQSSIERTTTTSRIPSLHSSSSYLLFQQFQIRRDLANQNPEEDFEVELGWLLALLPEEMRQRVKEHRFEFYRLLWRMDTSNHSSLVNPYHRLYSSFRLIEFIFKKRKFCFSRISSSLLASMAGKCMLEALY